MNRKTILKRIQDFHKRAWFKQTKELRTIKADLDRDFDETRKQLSQQFFKKGDVQITYPMIYTIVQNAKAADERIPENMRNMLHSLIYYQQTVRVKKAQHVTISQEKFEEFKKIEVPGSFPVKRMLDLLPDQDLFLIVDEGSIYYFTREAHLDGMERVALYRYVSDNLFDYYYYNLSSKVFEETTMDKVIAGEVDYIERDTLESLIEEFNKSYKDQVGVGVPDKVRDFHLDFVNNELTGLINILAYLKSKNVSVVKTDYNPELPQQLENLKRSKGKKQKTIQKKIDQMEKFLFVEIDECKYHYKPSSNGGTISSSKKRGHWRRAHFHLYWKGKKDQENRDFTIHYIPTLFVGDPENRIKKVEVIK